LKAILLAIGLAVSTTTWPSPAFAKKQGGEFAHKGIGCWERTFSGTKQRWCFHEDGTVEGSTVSQYEGFGETGLFRHSRDEIIILGFPGVGWPATSYAETCRYHFNPNGQTLTLENCGVAGDWIRAP
jgi:hypothetical protein